MAAPLLPQVCAALAVILALSSEHFIQPCDANAFRGSGITVAAQSANASDIKQKLLAWALGGGGADEEHPMNEMNIISLEEQFGSIFTALPKNIHGNLDHAAVRYALHRFFLQTNGMYIKGLGPDGEAWNKTSSSDIIEERVPTYVLGFFLKHLGEKGLGQHELAVIAATLEHLVYEEQIQMLDLAFQETGVGQITIKKITPGSPQIKWEVHRVGHDEAVASEEQIAEVIETYMQIFLLGKNESILKGEDVLTQRKALALAYPNWSGTQLFLERVRKSVLGTVPGSSKKFSFTDAAHVVQEVGKQYGHWANSDCQDLKKTLVGIEDQGSGRVKIQDFYSGALGGKWHFDESIAYLRDLGAIDDSDPTQLRVFISNYINSPSNCLVSSSFYSICCFDECEGLLSQLEKRIAGPDATPKEISGLAAAMGTPAAEAVSESLQQRLEEIARQHQGRVPLHGRLFAQWMHHAFPRECAYPHRSGTTRPLTADEWMQETGLVSKASADEIKQHTVVSVDENGELFEEVANNIVIDGMCPPSPWEPEEELFVSRAVPPSAKPRHPYVGAISTLVFIAALVAMGLTAKQIVQASLLSVQGGQGSAKKL